jgi:putative transcription factor
MQCDMCGKNTNLYRTKIEGAELNLCKECGIHGKVIGSVKTKEEIKFEEQKVREFLERKKTPKEIETNERIVENFSEIMRRKREKMGLTQEEFAKKLNERESIIHNIEKGTFYPPISLARKLERQLDIKLVDETKFDVKIEHSGGENMTIGDILNTRKL